MGLLLAFPLHPASGQSQVAQLIDDFGVAHDLFGSSVASDGDVVVVGVPRADVGGEVDEGSAVVYRRAGTVWVQEQTLLDSSLTQADLFGAAVAVSGDIIVVGSPAATVSKGTAWVFRWNGTSWIEEQRLLDSNGLANDNFGRSVAISGNVIVVGSPGDDVGPNSSVGSATVFEHNGSSWVQKQELLDGNGWALDRFGWSVAISGDVIVVGSPGDDVGGHDGAGSGTVFRHDGTSWVEEAELVHVSAQPADSFGESVDVAGDLIIVGVDQDDIDGETEQGSAFIYRWDGSQWNLDQQLTDASGEAEDGFGTSVTIGPGIAVVGSPNADSGQVACAGHATVYRHLGGQWQETGTLEYAAAEASNQVGTAVALAGSLAVVAASHADIGANAEQGTVLLFGLSWPPAGTGVLQHAYLKASNANADDQFGYAVAVSGDTAVVGAWSEDSAIAGVDGGPDDNGAPDAGAAYVFVRNGVSWSQQAYLKPSDPDSMDRFGWSVAISGDTVIVGAYLEDDGAVDSGAAYIFVRNGTTWSQQAQLKASNGDPGDGFGFSVAVSVDTAVVGAWREDSKALDMGGGQGNNDASNAGAAYVFIRDGATWSQQAYLKASNAEALDVFGTAVAISGESVVVAAEGEDSDSDLIAQGEGDNSAASAGAAYVFVRSGSTWSQQAYLKSFNSDAFDSFGQSLSMVGDTLVVGALRESSGVPGVQGDPDDNSSTDAGAVYVFARNGTAWSQEAYLKASNTDEGDRFGRAVALAAVDALVVTAHREDSSATAVGGDEDDNAATEAGAAYVFQRIASTWSQTAYVKSSNSEAGDRFGWSVAAGGDVALLGARFEDSSATGVNGIQLDNGAMESGAAYVFDLDALPPWVDLGSALSGIHGEPVLSGRGSPVANHPVEVRLTNARENAAAFLFLGLTALDFSPFYGGTLVPDFTVPPGQLIIVFTDGGGDLTLGATWPSGVPSGFEIYLQYWIDDPAAPFGFSASNAIKGTTP